MRNAVASSLFLFLLGCSGGKTQTPLPCDVDAVLAQSCRECHGATPAFGAPMPLVTWEDLNAPAKSNASKKVFELVGTRIHDDANPMPQAPKPRLTAKEMKTLDDWIAQGAGKGASTCAPPDGGMDMPDVTNAACTPDVHLSGGTWTMPQIDDIYTCYGVDVPVDGQKQIIAIKPRVDNKKIVHHIVLYAAPNSVSSTPAQCAAFGMVTWPFVYAWAPGIGDFELPKEAGFPMSGTMHYVVQVHYNNIGKLTGQTDNSGFDLCTTKDLRPNDADVVAFGTNNFSIPAHGTLDVSCKYTLPTTLDGRTTFATFLHMHKIGTQISNTITQGGMDVVLGNDPNYSFEAQQWATLNPQRQFHTGDVVTTRCVWNNTTDANVKWGENTEQEMCFAFAAYYPKANLLSWALPAYTSQCVKK